MTSRYTAIIAGLEAATEPSREVDWKITKLAGVGALWQNSTYPFFTSSLDAATALCERMLPGWQWNILCSSPKRKDYSAWVYPADGWGSATCDDACHAISVKAPIDLLIAMFRALEAQEAAQ